jgi:hypothetical protein
MTDLVARSVGGHTVANPAYDNMQLCLRMQSEATPRGWFARAIGTSPLLKQARVAFDGAVGERQVTQILAELGSNWGVLHDAIADDASSYLIVGPPGIFTLTSQALDGVRVVVDDLAFVIAGSETDVARRALGYATRAERQLSDASKTHVVVTPVLAVSGATGIRFGKRAPALAVLQAAQLRRWFLDHVRTVSDETVAYFLHLALRTGNWNLHAGVSGDVVRRVQRFERLQQEIADAARRRRWVAIAAAAVVVATAVIALLVAL